VSHNKEEDNHSLVEGSSLVNNTPSKNLQQATPPSVGHTPSRLHGRSESSPKHFSTELYSPVSPLASLVDLSSKNSQASQNTKIMHISSGNWIWRHRSYASHNWCTYPPWIEHAGM